MKYTEARHRLDQLADQLTDSNANPPWLGEQQRVAAIRSLCQRILALTGEEDVALVCHNIDDPDYNSMVGDVVAVTRRLIVKASLRWRNGEIKGNARVDAVSRDTITKISLDDVNEQVPADKAVVKDWPHRVRFTISMGESSLILPPPYQPGHEPLEVAEQALTELLPELVSNGFRSLPISSAH